MLCRWIRNLGSRSGHGRDEASTGCRFRVCYICKLSKLACNHVCTLLPDDTGVEMRGLCYLSVIAAAGHASAAAVFAHFMVFDSLSIR